MRTKTMRFAAVLAAILAAGSMTASVGQSTGTFLMQPSYASAAAVGEAGVGRIGDLASAWYNPAVLGGVPVAAFFINKNVTMAEAEGFLGLGNLNLASAIRLSPIGVLAMEYAMEGLDDTAIVDETGEQTGDFGAYRSSTTSFAWGSAFLDKTLSVGLGVKAIQTLCGTGKDSAMTAGFDAGVIYSLDALNFTPEVKEPNFHIGASVANVLARLGEGDESWVYSPVTLGVAWSPLRARSYAVDVLADVLYDLSAETVAANAGVAVDLFYAITIRAGVSGIGTDSMNVGAGIGLRTRFNNVDFGVDYAAGPLVGDLGLGHSGGAFLVIQEGGIVEKAEEAVAPEEMLKQEWAPAVRAKPTSSAEDIARARELLDLGEVQLAVSVLTVAAGADPSNVALKYEIAAACVQSGTLADMATARRAIDEAKALGVGDLGPKFAELEKKLPR